MGQYLVMIKKHFELIGKNKKNLLELSKFFFVLFVFQEKKVIFVM